MKKFFLGTAVLVSLAVTGLTAGPANAQSRNSLTIGVTLEPPHLDPTAGAAAAIDETVYANVFEGLTRIDQNGAIQPQLAESWTVSGDEMVYTFKLKRNVTFHDGTSFEASDVVFSFERARSKDSVNAQKALFAAIKTVEAIDPETVRVTLSRPEGSLLFNLGWGDAVIVAPESTMKSFGASPFTVALTLIQPW